MRTLAEEGGDAVVAGRSVVTSRAGAVVDVLAAVVSSPAVNADTVVAAVSVVARASVLACVGHQLTLIHVFCAVLTWQFRKKRGHKHSVREIYECAHFLFFTLKEKDIFQKSKKKSPV